MMTGLSPARRPLDGDLHSSIRPAALEPSAAVSGCIVGHYAQHILSRLAEGGGRRRLAAECRGWRHFTLCFFYRRSVIGHRHTALSAKLAPRHGHWSNPEALGRRPRYLGIIGNPNRQCERIRQRRRKGRAAPTRALYAELSLFEADEGWSVSARLYERRDLVQWIKAHRNYGGLTVDDQRPGELLGPEILWHRHSVDAPLPARQEVCRLALVWSTWLDPVVRPNRDVQLSFRIPIVIAEKKAVAAVRIPKPTLEGASDALTRIVRRLHRQLLPPYECPACEQDHDMQTQNCCPPRLHPRKSPVDSESPNLHSEMRSSSSEAL